MGKTPTPSRKTKIILICCAAGFVAAAAAVLLGVLLTLPKQNEQTVNYLPQSNKGEFLVAELVNTKRPNGQPLIIARSYDGYPWEPVPDLDNAPTNINCDDQNRCTMDVDEEYTTRTIDVPQELKELSPMHLAARLHMQATFGADKDELLQTSSVYGVDYGLWVLDQMRLTPTLTRAYYRERANARPGQFDAGQLVKPCDLGSRWHRYAFESRDKGKDIVVSKDTNKQRIILSIDGVPRTEVTTILNQAYPANNLTFPFTLRLCSVNEEIGGSMTLNNITNTNCNIALKNPTIEFISNAAMQTLGDNDALLVPVVGARSGSFVLKSRTVPCLNLTDSAGNSFIRQGNSTYRFDKRIRFLANTIEDPSVVEASFSGQCPVIAKSYQNRDQCVRRASCGSAVSFKSATFTLDQNIVRSWYTKSRRFVYYITDLRLEPPFDISPCTSRNSRWLKVSSGACPSPTALDATTLNTITTALQNTNDPNPYVRDITVSGGCTAATNTIGANVTAGGACYRHVHPDYYTVRDFTRWVDIHDGNAQAMQGGKPNPIANFAQIGQVNFKFPFAHPMTRWADRRGYIPLVGRYGDSVDFQNLNIELQTEEIAALVGALRVNSDKDGFEACGSPGETSTSPELGYHYSVSNWNNTATITEALEWPLPAYSDHRFILENVHLKAYDQLRQRVAWSLSNIIVIASQDIEMHDYTDAWTSFYDIFVRNAFGSYKDIMRDVSYHPLMGTYLSYRGNRAFAVANTYPDENYAREIMQLFSIGLWRLNDDGTQQLDSNGQPLETYTNADIMDFARVWTGFDRQLFRSNLPTVYSVFGSNQNIIDNMQIRPQFRDRFPKAKLDSGYLGDTYPLCDDLPAQAFLREGARYEYTGPSSVEGDTIDVQNTTVLGSRGRFTPPTTSALYQALCAPSADKNGACTFPLRVTLTSNLPCTGDQECNAQRVLAVKIYDPVANVTRYYAYYGVPCVRLTLFDTGNIIKRASTRPQCADPTTRVGSPVCCKPTAPTVAASNFTSECMFANEVTDYATNKQRCEAMGLTTCSALTCTATWANTCARDVFMWTNVTCSVQVQVYHTGQVGIVDPLSGAFLKILKANSSNVFRVRWEDDLFPATNDAGVCPDGCTAIPTPEGDTCLCNITVSSSALYNQLSDLNSINANDAVNTLAGQAFIGAPKPSLFDDGTYTQCTNDECKRLSNVVVWFHKDDNGIGQRTIFELPSVRLGGRTRYLLNRISEVHVANSFAFRNPPHFTPLLGELTDYPLEWNSDALWTRKAEYEVESLLEHLFEHDNTAIFVSYRLIQHMVTSNPSPRYMRSVVQAFRTGAYGSVQFSGKYGDMAATIYAILMDQEARSPIIEADPTFGMLRDPLIKIYHLMRALDYNSPKNREVALWDMDNRIGVEPFSSPTVFNFYLPEYRPAGVIGDSGLVGPAVQLATTPNIVGFINGITSLIDNGLTSCDSGFAVSNNWGGRTCVTTGPHATADGTLTYTPPTDATTSDIVDELNLLLTAGRLNKNTREMLIREYDNIATNATYAPAALRHMLKLLVSSSEFQTSSFNLLTSNERQVPAGVQGEGRRFKAIVVIFEYGGCDSFNVLIPHSNCPTKDMYAEYAQVRTDAALNKTQVIQISSPAGTQVCNTFGVHPAMPKLAQLYKDGDALFATNVGAMVAPVTKDQLNKGTARVPPSLYAHNIMQRNVQNVYAQYISADGVLGRICDALQETDKPYAAAVFSLGGNVKMTQGSIPADYISPSTGVVRVRGLNKIGSALSNITEFTSNSVFAETYADTLFDSVRKTETLGGLLNATQLATNFSKSALDQQMVQVAKLIKALPDATGVERAVFFTQTGGFDTHNTFNLSPMLGTVDTALGSFADEMKAQGRWDDVVVITVSDFARTLSSNGQGTDHAWGGNHFVAGGGVKGGQILGTYPDTLTDDGPNILSRGRVIPTMPFEALWKGISEWFGVPDAEMDKVLPNIKNFPADKIYGQAQMFN